MLAWKKRKWSLCKQIISTTQDIQKIDPQDLVSTIAVPPPSVLYETIILLCIHLWSTCTYCGNILRNNLKRTIFGEEIMHNILNYNRFNEFKMKTMPQKGITKKKLKKRKKKEKKISWVKDCHSLYLFLSINYIQCWICLDILVKFIFYSKNSLLVINFIIT